MTFLAKALILRPVSRIRDRLLRSHLARRMAHGTLWSLAGNTVWRAMSMVSAVFVARILGKEAFGELGMVQSTIAVFAVLAGFRLGTTATKYVAEFRAKDPARAARILDLVMSVVLVTCGAMALACFLASETLARTVLFQPRLAPALAVGSVFLFCSLYGHVQEYALAGFEAFKTIAVINMIRGLGAPLICIPCALIWGMLGVVYGLTVEAAVVCVVCSILLRRERRRNGMLRRVSLAQMKTELPVLWQFALPGVLAGVVTALVMWIGNRILVSQPSGYAELGLFNAANQWRTAILFLPAILGRVVLPILSEAHGKQDKTDFRKAASLNVRVIWLIAFPLTAAIIGFGGPLSSIFGEKFRGCETVLPVLMLSVFFYSVAGTVQQAMDGAGRRWMVFVMTLGWAAVFVAVCLAAVPAMGPVGLALAYLAAYAILALAELTYIEVVLARKSISKHVPLFLYSFLILGLCCCLSAIPDKRVSFVVAVVLLALACIPTFSVLRTRQQQPAGPAGAGPDSGVTSGVYPGDGAPVLEEEEIR